MDCHPQALHERSETTIYVSTIGLLFFVGLSFFPDFFLANFSGYIYSVLLALSAMLFIFSKRAVLRGESRLFQVWLLSVCVLIIRCLGGKITNNTILDIGVFLCGTFLILFNTDKVGAYKICVEAIKKLGMYFAFGILIQRIFPPLYRLILVLYGRYGSILLRGGRVGFTLNTGFSAGYICAGIIAALSQHPYASRYSLKDAVVPGTLILALLFTGKRGPALFLILTVLYSYLSPIKGMKKIKRYWRIFLVVLIAVIVIWAFRDMLLQMPFFGRMLNSIAGVIDGEDVSSGRTKLFLWAWELFRRNPLFGIGWGEYRYSVIGHGTVAKSLETHNIYLQLLAETGIVGFAVFIAMFLTFWNSARVAFSDCVQNADDRTENWQKLLAFSFMYQTYFLLYGLTGNPLYDAHFQILYIFSCMIIAAYSAVKDQLKSDE